MQRRSEPSFFLINKTSKPCRYEVFLNEFPESFLFGCQKRVYGANQRLSTFQIDFEIIRMMRSENFSFSFAENISEFIILRRDIEKIRSFCKFGEISLNV